MKAGPAFIEKPDWEQFAVIGDVHGCYEELQQLVAEIAKADNGNLRPLVFVGDLVDRGPEPIKVVQFVMDLYRHGRGLAVKGNHDEKLYRWLSGRNVQLLHGLDKTAAQLKTKSSKVKEEIRLFIEQLPFQLFLAADSVVVAHAGASEKLQKQNSEGMRSFALYGQTTGKTDQHGLPERINWAADYHGNRLVVYGHTPVAETWWQHNTVNIDTGCAFGGKLTAFLIPERKTISVQALQQYSQPGRPFIKPADARN